MAEWGSYLAKGHSVTDTSNVVSPISETNQPSEWAMYLARGSLGSENSPRLSDVSFGSFPTEMSDLLLTDFPMEGSMGSIPGIPRLRRQSTKYLEANSRRQSESSITPHFGYMRPVIQGVSTTEGPKSVNVLMIGTGEYTTGFIDNEASETDKGAGVVALTLFDLRRRGKAGRLALCGVNGTKFPKIREHMKKKIANVYKGIDVSVETFPEDHIINPISYQDALKSFKRGDAVIIFTPDDTHYEIALEAVKKGLHVLVTKPLVQTLEQHQQLHQAAIQNDVLVIVEVHKRFDPIYQDARDKMMNLGPFSYLYSYMSQPKYQLDTFKVWAGKKSDISYYLNAHHIDFHEWCMGELSRPILVTATASTGMASTIVDYKACEDTITLTVQWQNLDIHTGEPTSVGTAIYTASWIAPRSDVHSQQRFFYMGHTGEIIVDQAHRGYSMANDSNGYKSVNPLFMKYTPTNGQFSGQTGYGYRSIEAFIEAVQEIETTGRSANVYDRFNHTGLATIASTYRTTAILEAGRRSLDQKKSIQILYEDIHDLCLPTNLIPYE